jgi:hypothetical protein
MIVQLEAVIPMQAGWIIGVARKTGGRIDAKEYRVAIGDTTTALNAVRRLVGRTPECHVWVKGPLSADDAAELARDTVRASPGTLLRASR